MLSFLRFLARRLIAIPIAFFIVTLILYGVAALSPIEIRAKLYWPPGASEEWLALNGGAEAVRRLNEQVIKQYGLDDPFPVQYARWLSQLLRGDWGSSFAVNDVLPALLHRTPVTAELTLYSVLLLIPLGLASGVVAGLEKEPPPRPRISAARLCRDLDPVLYPGAALAGVFLRQSQVVPAGEAQRL
jgi:peptide/nickel transport system permease protein